MPKQPIMPERVRKIKHEIQTRMDYTVLRNGGREAIYAYAKACGLRYPNTLIASWADDFRAKFDVSSWTHGKIVRRPATPVDDDEQEPIDDPLDPDRDDNDVDTDDANDDSLRQRTKLCPACRGTGRGQDGARCARCNGAGRVKVGDIQPDDRSGRYGRVYGFLESED
jgi:hypothetical protein